MMVASTGRYRKGQQYFHRYSRDGTTTKLALQYGFIIPNNPQDYIAIAIQAVGSAGKKDMLVSQSCYVIVTVVFCCGLFFMFN